MYLNEKHIQRIKRYIFTSYTMILELSKGVWYNTLESEGCTMSQAKLQAQSLTFSVHIINLVKILKDKRESIISNQIGISGTYIGACISEAQYAQSTSEYTQKLQQALKYANETSYWLELLCKTHYITEAEYKTLETACASIRTMLISDISSANQG